MKYHVLLDEKLWMTCDNYAACQDNIKGLNPPSMHHRFRIITQEELTIAMARNKW